MGKWEGILSCQDNNVISIQKYEGHSGEENPFHKTSLNWDCSCFPVSIIIDISDALEYYLLLKEPFKKSSIKLKHSTLFNDYQDHLVFFTNTEHHSTMEEVLLINLDLIFISFIVSNK